MANNEQWWATTRHWRLVHEDSLTSGLFITCQELFVPVYTRINKNEPSYKTVGSVHYILHRMAITTARWPVSAVFTPTGDVAHESSCTTLIFGPSLAMLASVPFFSPLFSTFLSFVRYFGVGWLLIGQPWGGLLFVIGNATAGTCTTSQKGGIQGIHPK